jgi:hypothetical protein
MATSVASVGRTEADPCSLRLCGRATIDAEWGSGLRRSLVSMVTNSGPGRTRWLGKPSCDCVRGHCQYSRLVRRHLSLPSSRLPGSVPGGSGPLMQPSSRSLFGAVDGIEKTLVVRDHFAALAQCAMGITTSPCMEAAIDGSVYLESRFTRVPQAAAANDSRICFVPINIGRNLVTRVSHDKTRIDDEEQFGYPALVAVTVNQRCTFSLALDLSNEFSVWILAVDIGPF